MLDMEPYKEGGVMSMCMQRCGVRLDVSQIQSMVDMADTAQFLKQELGSCTTSSSSALPQQLETIALRPRLRSRRPGISCGGAGLRKAFLPFVARVRGQGVVVRQLGPREVGAL